MTRPMTSMVVMAAVVAGASASAQGPGPRAFVLDQQARSVTVLELPSGRPAQTATVEGTPTVLLRAAAGRRLLVLDRGEGREVAGAGVQPKTRSVVTILDGATLAVQGRVELGWGLDPTPMLSASGDHLSVVCPGFEGRTPAESLPREVVTVDLAAARLLSRIALPRRATAAIATPDGRTALVLSGREEPRKAPVIPAELRILDVTAGTVAATLVLEGDPGGPVLSPDGQFVYLLDRGRPNNNPDRNVNGRLHAVSLASRTVEAVTEVGSKPRGLVLDEAGRQLLLLSDLPPVKGGKNSDRPGELRVIRGAVPGAPIHVGASPERLQVSDDGTALYVLGTHRLTTLTLPGLSPATPVVFDRLAEELRVSRDGRRAYVLNGDSFYTFDAATGKRIGDVRTGRTGKRMVLQLEQALEAETARLNAENEARRQGRQGHSYFDYAEYTLSAPWGTMAIRPDGKEIYVLNSQTSDVTVIDGETGAIIEKVPAGGFTVHFMPAASVALVPSASTVHAVDLATRKKVADVVTDSSGNFTRAELSPDGRLAVIHGSGGVLVVDGSSGKPAGTMKAFGRVVDVAIDWGSGR